VVTKKHAVNAVFWTGNTTMVLKELVTITLCYTVFVSVQTTSIFHNKKWDGMMEGDPEDYLIPFVVRTVNHRHHSYQVTGASSLR
jgi:hypothetical protein